MRNNKYNIDKLLRQVKQTYVIEYKNIDNDKKYELEMEYNNNQMKLNKEINIVDKQMAELEENLKKALRKYQIKIDESKKLLNGVVQEIKSLKFTLNFVIKDQRNYYLEIL